MVAAVRPEGVVTVICCVDARACGDRLQARFSQGRDRPEPKWRTTMNDAALPPADHAPLSPWWIRTILIVLVFGMVVLIAITVQGYEKAPPVPGRVVDAQGQVLFTGDDIRAGQAVFLKYGLMDNGSVWGHGAYLG